MSESTSQSASTIGPYQIERKLGEGAMAEVYCVRDESGAWAALKILSPGLCDDEDARMRFDREAEALEKIHHRSVARLLSRGTAPDGRPYLVSELVEGQTLAEVIASSGATPALQGLEWMVQSAEGLAEAWKHHIIHRDVKPANLMLDAEGHIKLVDFGLAHAVFSGAEGADGPELLGTPTYLSPEMALGQSLDLRADMYSLGATFYHLLLGEAPFQASSVAELIRKHAGAPPRAPHYVEPSLPEDLCYVLERLLQKDPSKRYECYSDLIGHLRKAKLAMMSKENMNQEGTPTSEVPASEELSIQDMLLQGEGSPESLEQAPPPPAGDITAEADPNADEVAPAAPAADVDPSSFVADPSDQAMRQNRAIDVQVGHEYEQNKFRTMALLLVGALLVCAGVVIATDSQRRGPDAGGSEPAKWLADLVPSFSIPGLDREAQLDAPTERIPENRSLMSLLMTETLKFEASNGRAPKSLEELNQIGWIYQSDLSDSWGHAFQFQSGGKRIRSAGPDGTLGTGDDLVIDSSLRFVD